LLFLLYTDEDGSKRFLVDFEQKNLTTQAERRKSQQQTADAGETDQQKQSREEDEELVLDTEEPMPDNADEQWSVIVTASTSFHFL